MLEDIHSLNKQDHNKVLEVSTFNTTLSDEEFNRLSKLIQSECGIKMPPAKKAMLEARLRKRLHELGLMSFSEYCNYLFSPSGITDEVIHMIDAVTTNKTDFFREPKHFDYLTRKVLPELITVQGAGIRKRLIVWSAGCSTGEEPYTLAMVLSEFTEKCQDFRFDYLILATDISTKALKKAKLAIYEQDRTASVPFELKKKYLLKSKDKNKGLVRIIPELRSVVKFRRLNFMDDNFEMHEPVDVIFCRNVIIYFDRPTQEIVLNKFYKHLNPGGYIFMGHSETLHGLDVPLIQVAPTVYRKPL
jgi:chemotaxis protein methyltransferase CheR